MKLLISLFISSILLSACLLSDENNSNDNILETRVIFYNVENLFDTIDHIHFADEDFLPNSPKQWNTNRFLSKIDHLSEVINKSSLNEQLPGIIGLVEVENKEVVEWLFDHPSLKETNYKIVHEDSKDERGIDVTLIFNQDLFKYISHEVLSVKFKDFPLDRTRDILMTHLKTQDGEDLYVFVNHWPSRREGKEFSEPKRIAAAKVLRNRINRINKDNKNAKIIIGGDFNDEPADLSIADVLKAKPFNPDNKKKVDLINISNEGFENGKGTYFYWKDSDWNMLDQLIISNNFILDADGLHCNDPKMQIFDPDFLIYKDSKGNLLPSKTYGGSKYYNGYSDHFAVYFDIQLKGN